jgi:hypothetical protein
MIADGSKCIHQLYCVSKNITTTAAEPLIFLQVTLIRTLSTYFTAYGLFLDQTRFEIREKVQMRCKQMVREISARESDGHKQQSLYFVFHKKRSKSPSSCSYILCVLCAEPPQVSARAWNSFHLKSKHSSSPAKPERVGQVG